MKAPAVSVVMGVFNGAATLAMTMDSVLGQVGCDLEFIVVDDGSIDASPGILAERARRDSRLRVLHQPHSGLTRALALGCGEAKGRYIARQDCGDRSLAGRFSRQCELLDSAPEVVLTACGVRYIGPGGEPLFESARRGAELEEGLAQQRLDRIKGPPHHGATMFRREAYRRAGGYRPAFTVAQDMDLWLRLREQGRCFGDGQPGYEARLEAGSISGRKRSLQFKFAALALECAERRRDGKDDDDLLAAAAHWPAAPSASERHERARFHYFIGSCLRATDTAAARRYFWLAWREHPALIQALVQFAFGGKL